MAARFLRGGLVGLKVFGRLRRRDFVAQARSAAREAGDERTTFEVADAMALPWADDSFDVVHAHQVLQHVPEPVRALREMARVTRPGGTVAVRDTDYSAFTWWPRLPELDTWLDLYVRAARANGGEPDAGRGGAHPDDLPELCAAVDRAERLDLAGLMTVAPPQVEPARASTSSSGAAVRACTSSPVRAELAAAVASGTTSGSTVRAVCVLSVVSGTRTTALICGCRRRGTMRVRGSGSPGSVTESVAPP